MQALPAPLLYEAWVRWGAGTVRGIEGVDLIHAPSLAVPPRSGRPLVVTVHDAAPELFPEAFTARGRRFHRLGMAAAARRADAVITVSRAAADEIVARSPIPADRLHVVPNGVDPPVRSAETDRSDAEALDRLGLAGRQYVLWVGSLEPRKGVGTLVGAMAELARRGTASGVSTVLAGYAGWLNDDVLPDGACRALGSSLLRLGRVGEGDLWALYRHATVFAFPSRHEGFGMPVIEAMSQGVAVVASDIEVMREVAGPAALLVPPDDPTGWADAIEGLISDPAERLGLGRAGVERSRAYTGRAMASATRAVYQTVGS